MNTQTDTLMDCRDQIRRIEIDQTCAKCEELEKEIKRLKEQHGEEYGEEYDDVKFFIFFDEEDQDTPL